MTNSYSGSWLPIKTADDYSTDDIIEFNGDCIEYYYLENDTNNNFLSKVKQERTENLHNVKHKFITPNHIRSFRDGKQHLVYSDTRSVTTDIIVERDYQKLVPTVTNVSESEICNMVFDILWNNENIKIVFDTILDPPYIQEINKRLGKEGSKIVLEKLDKTLLISFYCNAERDRVLPIKELTTEKIVLYGFPEEPYEITSIRTNT